MQLDFSESSVPTVALILSKAATETTVHGLSRLAGQRPMHVKICWLLSFLIFFGAFTYSMYGFTAKLITGEVNTSYKAESVDFEFPDVYFCSNVQISGTYSVTLPDSVADDINVRMNATFATFDSGLQQVLMTSLPNLTWAQVEQLKLNRLKAAIQSLPYKLLVDNLGHRTEQTVLKNDTRSDVTLTPFHHPNHLKCLKVELTEQRRAELSKVNSELSFQFLLDPYFVTGDATLGVSSHRQVQSVIAPTLNNLTINVYDWDLENPHEIDRPNGMHLYLAPRGEYPSRFVTKLLMAPGKSYSIGLTMQSIAKDPDTFQGQCLAEAPEVAFHNPYDGSAYRFKYSSSFCYFSEFARQLSQNGCSPYVNPLPWEFRDLRFCLNLTGLNESAIQSNLVQAFTADKSALKDFREMCLNRQLCLSKQYATSVSSANWPNRNGQIRVVLNQMYAIMSATPGVNRPFWYIAFKGTLEFAVIHPDLVTAEAIADAFFSRSGVKVTLQTQESRSSQIVLSSSYSLASYVSDMGGTAGIYLGCSLLSLCELVELVYDLVTKTRKKKHQGAVRTVQVMPTPDCHSAVHETDSGDVDARQI